MLVLSMLSIDKFPYQLKLKLRNSLIIKCRLISECKTKRKKMIRRKREGYASGKIDNFEEKVMNKFRRYHERVSRSMWKKIKKIRKNLEKEII